MTGKKSVKDYYDDKAKKIIKAVKDGKFSDSELKKLLDYEKKNKDRVTVKRVINAEFENEEGVKTELSDSISIDWRIPVAFLAGVIVTFLIFNMPSVQFFSNNNTFNNSTNGVGESVELVVLNDDSCPVCDASWIESRVDVDFGTVEAEYVDVNSELGQEYVDELGVESVPAAFFTSSVENAGNFSTYEENNWIIPVSDYYLLSIQGTKFLSMSESSTPTIAAFVMSECPYGQPAQETVINTKEEIPGFNLEMHYIGTVYTEEEMNEWVENNMQQYDLICAQDLGAQYGLECTDEERDEQMQSVMNSLVQAGDKYYASLHGESEINNNIAQLCAINYYENWTGFVQAHIDNNLNTSEAIQEMGYNASLMNECINGSVGRELFEEDVQVAEEYMISASPTYVFDNNLVVTSGVLNQFDTTVGGLLCSLHPELSGCENVDQIETTTPQGSC